MDEETIRIEDHKLEAFGDCYRAMCGPNDVLLLDPQRKPLTFEGFLKRIGAVTIVPERLSL